MLPYPTNITAFSDNAIFHSIFLLVGYGFLNNRQVIGMEQVRKADAGRRK